MAAALQHRIKTVYSSRINYQVNLPKIFGIRLCLTNTYFIRDSFHHFKCAPPAQQLQAGGPQENMKK